MADYDDAIAAQIEARELERERRKQQQIKTKTLTHQGPMTGDTIHRGKTKKASKFKGGGYVKGKR